jgi:thiol-disulfide isomerase/thioredoxin
MDELDLRPAERDEMPASELTLEHAPRLRTGVGSAFLDDEGVLLDPATGASHLLDAPAALVVRFLDGSARLAEIAFDIADVLGVDRERVEGDVLGLARTLGSQGLLEGVARDPRAARPQPSNAEGVPVGADLGGWPGWSRMGDAASTTLLVNWGTRCGFCTRIAPGLAELSPRLAAAGVRLVLVTTGSEEAFGVQVGELPLEALHVEEAPDFFAGLGTPVAYLVDRDHAVLEPIAIGAADVPALAGRLVD